MQIHNNTLIAECSSYDFKEMLERKKVKSWLKSVSAFANTDGGSLFYGVNDDGVIVGLENPQADADFISEMIKARLDPVPEVQLIPIEHEGRTLLEVRVKAGTLTPYYYYQDGTRTAYTRVGNESVECNSQQLLSLVLKGTHMTWDSLPTQVDANKHSFVILANTFLEHAVCHALNLKETARRHAISLGKKYEDCNFIVCHIDGGISITAHKKGKMIDGNDAGGGEGPFTPTRMGTMAVTDITRYFWDKKPAEMKSLCSQTGGLSSYFGTSNSDTIHKMVEEVDKKAARVWNAMIYQVIKYIGSMSTVLQGKVDGIVLTGGLLRFPEIEEKIRESCGWIAPVTSYPGEFEQEAMAFGALRVLRGEEEAKIYPGKPVWDGFKD